MLPLSTRMWIHLKTLFYRVTRSRITLFFFLASFGFCFTQGLVQSFLYSVDQDYSSLLQSILDTGAVPYDRNFATFHRGHDHYSLDLCENLPVGGNHGGKCTTIWNSTMAPMDSSPPFLFPNGSNSDVVNIDRSDTSDGTQVVMKIQGVSDLTLNNTCLKTLIYPDQVLKNAKREELALIGSQFWLLVTTIYAIVSESVPHLIAALIVRVVSTGWSAYSIWRTTDVQQRFNHLVVDGPCHADLFPSYLIRRQHYELPDLVFSVIALLTCAIMTVKLTKVYKEQTLGRMGTTEEIQSIYRFFMAVLACLQLTLYFMLTSLSLWLDQVLHGALSHIATFSTLYKAQSIIEIILLLPWVALGWYAITREHRIAIAGFIAWAVVMVVCTSLDFYSIAFRWTYVQWPFFGSVTTAGLVALVFAAGFAGVCTARFGRGFANYLHAERVLAQTDFAPDEFVNSPHSDIEKAPLPWDLDIKPTAPAPVPNIEVQRASPVQETVLPTYLRPFGQ